MKKILFIGILLITMTSCSSKNDFEKGKQQLENQGYTSITNTNWKSFCCSEKDNFSTGFEAIDKEGRKVEGCICSGVLKGITIRFK